MSQSKLDKILSEIKKLDSDELTFLRESVSNEVKALSGRRKKDNLYKRGKYWYFRFRFEGKEYRGSGGTSKDVAREKMTKLKRELERGAKGLPKRSTLTLAEFSKDYLDWVKNRNRSMKRFVTSMKHLTAAMGTIRLVDIDLTRVEQYKKARISTGVKGPTVNRELACLRSMLNWAVKMKELSANPTSNADIMFPESPARVPVLSEEDERKLLEASPDWLRFLIQMAIATACRRGELLALKWGNIDTESRIIAIENSKSGKSRRVPYDQPAFAKALERLKGRPDEVVVTLNGKSPEQDTISHAFKRSVVRAGLSNLRFHDLRHIAVDRFHEAGFTLDEMAAITGHETLNMAKRYSRLNEERVRTLLKKTRLVDTDEIEPYSKGKEAADRRTDQQSPRSA